MTAQSITELIGNTPLLALTNYSKKHRLQTVLIGKTDFRNPAGSIKDRIAKAMLEDAKASGKLQEGSVIIEPTSGNTGVALASLAAAGGYRIILTMPETMSVDRRKLLKAYGAEIVLTSGTAGMKGAIDRANELAREIPFSFVPGQFENPANPKVHYETTGPEIWNDTQGRVDMLIAGVGTGGTITGAGKYLKERNPKLQVIAVEPAGSPVLSGGEPGHHRIQGIGAGFVPKILDRSLLDEVVPVTNEDAFETVRELATSDGLLAGISSGAVLWAAARMARREENHGKVIVAILPDSGERYLSTRVFQE